jgi:hypothetical protein
MDTNVLFAAMLVYAIGRCVEGCVLREYQVEISD